jgi:hypothetical protein
MQSLPEVDSHAPIESLNSLGSAEAQPGILQPLRGLRHRLGTVLIGVLVTSALASDAIAATIVMRGEIIPASDVTNQPEYALALTNGVIDYTIANVDGTANATMTWFGVKSPAFVVERYVDMGSDVPSTVRSPDQFNDGNRSDVFLTIANLPELKSLHYALDARFRNGPAANLFRFLENAELHVGFGPIVGDPLTIEEAIQMTQGPVLRGVYPGSVELDDAWILRSTFAPEPSTLGLAGSAVGAGLACRRRTKRALRC